ncbi:MMPL family transporter [Cognaticolwellia aestuarii]|uniref:MMPL family transporter n=1 Tax=Cognaticolwellia aestuarii TaxID=329993 RepID=UPI000987A604|nr:hypothetical protein [Cognaticolwellia aestuarii]
MRDFNKLKKLYWLQLLAVFLLGGYLLFFGQWRIESNLLSILPHSAQQQDFSAAEQALFKSKSQQLLVLIAGDNALKAHDALAMKVHDVANVSLAPLIEPSLTDIAEFYRPFRHNFLTSSYLEHLDNSQALAQLATKQIIQVANPFVSETIATAPRLNLAEYLQVALSNLADVEFDQGVAFVNVQGQRYLISRLQVTLDGLDLNTSVDISAKLQQLFNDIRNVEKVELIYSGILFHTAESTRQAKTEISTFGVLSLVAVLLLIWSAFRSMLPLWSAVLVLSIASAYGFIAILLFFQSLHLLTLVFAITLIGVVIDYCFHALVYADRQKNLQQDQKSNPLTKPLVLGFITTAIGYFILVFSPLTLLSQVAVFMIFGLFGALITVLALLPQLKGFNKITSSASAVAFSQQGVNVFSNLVRYKKMIISLLVFSLVSLAVLAPIKFDDDVRLLNSSPKWLIEQEISVAKALNYHHSQRLIIKAKTTQEMLEIQEQVIDRVLANQANIRVKGINKLLPSIKRQQQHHALLAKADEQGHFQAVLALSGLDDPVNAFKPLTFQDFLQGPLAAIGESYIAYYDTGNGLEYASWLELSQAPLSAENLLWLAENPHVSLYDTASDVSDALGQYRQGILWLLASAFMVVVVILFAKYGLKAGALSAIATIGSALLALTLSQLFSSHLNIFNLLAVLLIIALAIDYVIFYQEHGLQVKTFLAISLSALSSAAVFGILVFSATPAVSSFGLTVMIGIVSIFILAPIATKNINLNDMRSS